MKNMYEPSVIGRVSAPNRLIRSATYENALDENERFVPALAPVYEALAEGRTGVIITGMIGVNEYAQVGPGMLHSEVPDFVAGMKDLAERVHKRGSRVVAQINHCGLKTFKPGPNGLHWGPADGASKSGQKARQMSAKEIGQLARDFAATAAHCRAAGLDGVQIHAAHGYLLSEFLSPHFNTRQDEYGGDIKGRSRAVFEVYDAVRQEVGPDYPVWIKIHGSDLVADGLKEEEFIWVCERLDQRGIDAIEVSSGIWLDDDSSCAPKLKKTDPEGRFGQYALNLAENVSASVISVAGYRTPEGIQEWLDRGKIAAISLCRPLISEPGLFRRWQEGDTTRARCISCNKCFQYETGFNCKVFKD